MFLRGINYDTGTAFTKGSLSRPDFDEAIVKKEIGIIKNELHCDAIKIAGDDLQRLLKASEFALELGLQVWLAPSNLEATKEEALPYFIECAKAAEKLRLKYGHVIFIAGFELSLFMKGFIKGETLYDRLKNFFNMRNMILNALGFKKKMHRELNQFLKEMTGEIRVHYKGQVTYSSGIWEHIDWGMFDIVGIDHYRAKYNRSSYQKELQKYYKFNKPVAAMEFGCCAYKGADDAGPMGWAITEDVNGKKAIKAGIIRDESVQAKYITDLLDIFKQEQVIAAFVFTFVIPVAKYNDNPRFDFDLSSYGIVKPVDEDGYKGLPWVPKEAFYKLGEYYGNLNPQ
jgi:hypothetical protein